MGGMVETTAQVQEVYERIKEFISLTPLEKSVTLSQKGDSSVFLKCENMQYTGSFKVRGALNKIVLMSKEDREKGIIAASTGNHGMATCYAAQKVGDTPVSIYVPKGASEAKLNSIRSMKGEVIQIESSNCIDGELAARKASVEQGKIFLSPYNDKEVMMGQATIAHEICEQLGTCPDVVFVSVGGGGLIAGVASYLKAVSSECKVIGCQPENSNVMMQSITAGKILDDVEEFPTLSDGTAGGIEENSITFPVIQKCVDEFVSVTEEEIANGMIWSIENEHMLIEGAAAVVIASYLKQLNLHKGKNVVLLLCGRNVSYSVVKKLLS